MSPPGLPDPRYELVLVQAERALRQQVEAVENVRTRGATIIAAATLVSSFLGAVTLDNRDQSNAVIVLSGLALAALVAVIVSVVYILYPRQMWTSIDARLLLRDYVEAEDPADIDSMRRDLAYYLAEDVFSTNEPKVERVADGPNHHTEALCVGSRSMPGSRSSSSAS